MGKTYVITDLAYNYEKNNIAFITIEGSVFVYFPQSKSTVQIKKDYKRIFLIDWIYNSPSVAHLFVAEEGGVRLYKF